MERVGTLLGVKGGGAGVGFQTPREILVDEPRRFFDMVSDLKEAMDANEPIATQGIPRTLGKCYEEEEESRRQYRLWSKRLRRITHFLKQYRLKRVSWENELKCQAKDSILHTPESRMVIIP